MVEIENTFYRQHKLNLITNSLTKALMAKIEKGDINGFTVEKVVRIILTMWIYFIKKFIMGSL